MAAPLLRELDVSRGLLEGLATLPNNTLASMNLTKLAVWDMSLDTVNVLARLASAPAELRVFSSFGEGDPFEALLSRPRNLPWVILHQYYTSRDEFQQIAPDAGLLKEMLERESIAKLSIEFGYKVLERDRQLWENVCGPPKISGVGRDAVYTFTYSRTRTYLRLHDGW